MIKIGYLGAPENDGGVLGLELLEECKPTPIGLLGGVLSRCPATRGYHMNTFEVKCPYNLEFTITRSEEEKETGDWSAGINPDKTSFDLNDMFWNSNQILNFTPDGTTVQVIHPGWSFVSDTPNTIMLKHSNGIVTNPQQVTGQLDIYKWPDRQMSVGYYLDTGKDEQTFTLKRGQPWYRLTFFTPGLETVKLVRMEERPEFLKRTHNKSQLALIKYTNWRKVFTDFGNSRPKKLIP